MTYNYRNRGIEPHGFDLSGSRWLAEPFGDKGHFILRLEEEYDAMTGQAVSENLQIPYPHRLVHFQAKHTSSTGANDTTALTAGQFKRRKFVTTSGNSNMFVLWDFSGVVAADFLRIFSDGYEYPRGEYQITVNTTNGHRMYYEVYIQLLDKKGREAPNRN